MAKKCSIIYLSLLVLFIVGDLWFDISDIFDICGLINRNSKPLASFASF
jgi:hypothetical protein